MSADGAGNIFIGNEYRVASDFGGGVTLPEPPPYVWGEYLAKLSPSGDAMWAQKVPELHLSRLAAGDSGSFWTATIDGSAGTTTVHRFDSSGALLWSHPFSDVDAHAVFPGEGDRLIVPFGISIDGLDYGTGTIEMAPSVTSDVAVLVFDASGNVVSARSLGEALWPGTVSARHSLEVRKTVRAPGGGGFLLVATQIPLADTKENQERRSLVVRLGPQGDVMWSRSLPDVAKKVSLEITSGPEGQALLLATPIDMKESVDFGCGAFQGQGVALAKFEPDGTAAWTRTFPGLAAELRASFALNGDVILSGYAAPPCDFGGGEIFPPSDDYDVRFVLARLGPDGGHRRSGVVDGLVWPASFNSYVSFIDHEGNLVIAGDEAIPPSTQVSRFVAKIAP
ncbi:Hypothetical protein A7982_04020 [Minicystis rosea]|nr:Hypothetical protein A7982_04020 [Minicystis rosea]